MKAIVSALFSASRKRNGGLYASRGMADSMRDALATMGAACVPVGDGDAKTASPGTYRPVGGSCPKSCPYLDDGCYAQGGNVNTHQRRAQESIEAAANGAALAMVWARQTGRVARLHVSGDGKAVDGPEAFSPKYADLLCAAADAVNRMSGQPQGTVCAWSYTHFPVGAGRTGQLIERLASHGIIVRASDKLGHGGAVVMPFADVPAVRKATGVKLAKCPAQLGDTDCNACRLCWTRPDLTIVFSPHGATKKRAAAASPHRNASAFAGMIRG